MYCEMQIVRIKESFKQEITLQETVTNKLLQGDCMRKKTKIISLREVFKELFKNNVVK